jgi:EmrB/QacA subfamily drug resistance transporter
MAKVQKVRPESRPGNVRAGAIILTACIAQIMIVLDSTIVVVALPQAQAELGFSQGDRQWVITAYSLAFAAFVIVGGRVAERWGLVPSYRTAILGFGVASAVGGLSNSLAMLLIARAAQGTFAALLGPTNLAMVSTGFQDPKQRAKAFGAFGATAGAGAALGLVLGGVLTEYTGWRWCFYINIVFALAGLLLIRRAAAVFPAGGQSRSRTDYPSLAIGSLSMFAIVFGLSQASTHPWISVQVLASIGVGVLLAAGFVVRIRHTSNPLLPPGLLSNPVRLGACLVVLMVGVAQLVTSIYLSYFFQRVQGWSALATGNAMLPLVGGLVVAAVVSSGVLVPRFGTAVVFLGGLLTLAAGFGILSQLDESWRYLPRLFFAMVVVGVGIGAIMPVAVSAITAGVNPEHAGVASSLSNSCQQLGGSLGVAAATSFAVSQTTRYLSGHSDSVKQVLAHRLQSAGTAPNTPLGHQIAGSVQQQFLHTGETWAYARGFFGLMFVYAIVAVVVFALTRTKASVEEPVEATEAQT